MAWKDNLRPASFRGIKFFIDASQFTGGRRVAFHEFPDRDQPYPEDLGKVGRTFKVDGHILGDDYFVTKQSLIEATDKAGPGELIHPYFGTKQVQCGAFSIDEDTKEGRIAKISFQFYEAGSNRFPKTIDDKLHQLDEKADAAKAASKAAFDKKYSVEKLPGFGVDSARKSVADAAAAFANATKGAQTSADETAELAFALRNLVAETNDLLQSPAKLSQRLSDSADLLKNAIPTSIDRFPVLATLFGFGKKDAPIPGNTPSRERERANKNTFDTYMQQTAIIEAARETADVEYPSVEEATAKRVELRDLIEEQILATDDDDVFQTFEDLQAQIVRALPDSDSDLPNIETITLSNVTSSLVLAYDLFERPDAEENIIERNEIRNPGFIPSGSTLEVLDVRKSS